MVTSPLLLALLTATLLTASPAQQTPQPPADAAAESALRQLEQQLADTLRTKSRADMERLLSETFLLRATPDADRDTWITEALGRCWGDRFDIDDFTARLDGTSAVASFVMTSYVNPETCEPATLRSLITDVWQRDGDAWRLALRHSSAAASGVATQFAVVPETPPRWVLLGELSFVSTAGNTSTRTTGLASDLRRQTDASSSHLRFAYVSSEADDVTQARATTVQARHGLKLREHLEVFGRGAYARDRFAGIDNRAAVDAGLAYTTGRPPRHQLAFEGGVGFTAEERVAAETLRFATGTGTARYLWQVAPGTELREEIAIISDLGEGRNWRAANTAAISVTLTQLLSLKVSNDVEYRNLPVFGFRRSDMRTAAAVVLTLRAQ
jgi:putative salt-induced outer membrane protein YdiY